MLPDMTITKNLNQLLPWLRMMVLTKLTVMQCYEYVTGHDCWQQSSINIAVVADDGFNKFDDYAML